MKSCCLAIYYWANNAAVARCFHAAYTPKYFKEPPLCKFDSNLPETTITCKLNIQVHIHATVAKYQEGNIEKWWVSYKQLPKINFYGQ